MEKKNALRFRFLILIYIGFTSSYGQKYIPNSTTKKIYDFHLKMALKNSSYYEEQLARLMICENKDTIFKNLISRAQFDISLCKSVVKYQYLFKEKHVYNDLIIIYNLDVFNDLCNQCSKTLVQSNIDKNEIIAEEENFLFYAYNNKNGKYDRLISQLDTIRFDDQYYRKKIFCLPPEDSLVRRSLMIKMDSINLVKVGKIINEYHILSEHEVGKYHLNTIWLVLHHQVDCSIREKYTPYLEEMQKKNAIDSVDLELYLRRTKSICEGKLD